MLFRSYLARISLLVRVPREPLPSWSTSSTESFMSSRCAAPSPATGSSSLLIASRRRAAVWLADRLSQKKRDWCPGDSVPERIRVMNEGRERQADALARWADEVEADDLTRVERRCPRRIVGQVGRRRGFDCSRGFLRALTARARARTLRAYGVGDDVCLDRRLTESDLATDLHVGDALFAHEAVDESLLHAEAPCRALFVDERIGVEELLLLGVSRSLLRCRAGAGATSRVLIAATYVRSAPP